MKIPSLKLGIRGSWGEKVRDLVSIPIHSENGVTKESASGRKRERKRFWTQKRAASTGVNTRANWDVRGAGRAPGEAHPPLPNTHERAHTHTHRRLLLLLLSCTLEFTYPQIPFPTLLITTRSGPRELNIVANPAEGVLCQYTLRLGYVCRD